MRLAQAGSMFLLSLMNLYTSPQLILLSKFEFRIADNRATTRSPDQGLSLPKFCTKNLANRSEISLTQHLVNQSKSFTSLRFELATASR
jgi:hypothetical protein